MGGGGGGGLYDFHDCVKLMSPSWSCAASVTSSTLVLTFEVEKRFAVKICCVHYLFLFMIYISLDCVIPVS